MEGMERLPDNRADIRDFLATRRAKITPEQVGLPTSGRRRVPGLRREEVAVLAGVSTEWYTRLEQGHISGVSEDVLDAVARALQLEEDERTYLFDLARAAQPPSRTPRRRKAVDIPPRVQWLLDSMTLSAAFVTNGRLDIVATNALARALFAPLFDSETTDERGRRTSPGTGSSTPAHPTSSSTGTAPSAPPSLSCAPRPGATRTTRRCASWSVSCAR